jgi:hypothetical protein
MTITDLDTRKRLIINRHIAKMSPEEIARRFIIAYTAPVATEKQRRAQAQAMERP